MAHDNVDEVLAESTLTRRTLLGRSAQGAAALSLGGLVTAERRSARGGAQLGDDPLDLAARLRSR